MSVCPACRESTSGSCYLHPKVISIGPYASGTVAMRQCPTCDGRGVNPVYPWLLCPKCNGERWLA